MNGGSIRVIAATSSARTTSARGLGLVLVALLSAAARAQGAPATPAELELDPAARARFMQLVDAETSEAGRVGTWRWTWTGIYAALTVGQLAPVPFFKDSGLQADFVVGAATCVVGAALLVFAPLAVVGDAPKVKALPPTRAGLLEAERLVREDADDEAFNRSWVLHAGNVALNAAAGLVLGLGWTRWESAALTFAVGTLVGEVMIFTQPHGLSDVAAPAVALVPLAGPGVSGLALTGRW